MSRTVLLPVPPGELGDLPGSLEVRVWDGSGPAPEDLSDVAFYVPPYMAGSGAVDVVARMPALEVVQTLTAGVEQVRGAVPEGVVLCNARGLHDASTAELAVALALGALRGFPGFVRAAGRGEWAPEHRRSLADRTVLVLGYGSIGAAVERRLAGFEVAEVLRVARRAREAEAGPVHAFGDLDGLLPRAEVVVVVVPLTDETRGLLDARRLALLPDGAVVVNVARGPVLATDALLAELRSGRLLAGLDVTDPEPLPADHPLWSAPGLLLSPHVGGNTTAMLPRARRLLREQLGRWAAGEPLANVVTGAY
ncbi:2-hydroxyacid dehydrogenase [Vallicoccus soli]|uniref:Dihydrofolate reductase n=1 Tax=Vallicoccus soli TaxID=2339232 RepID=A0A3A3Z8I0_9ACTN|nr:2-hydroxyacid dehydrogenase [Vallicoccus soli]RJK98217.1 dihydrofolate reductase [Vallicoccus soli]